MRTRFAPLIAKVKETIYGPEPVGYATAAVLQNERAAELGGRMGTPHFGMKGSPENSFFGLVASPQEFVGPAQMGASPGVTVQEQAALPNDQPPPALPTWYGDWQNTEAMLG